MANCEFRQGLGDVDTADDTGDPQRPNIRGPVLESDWVRLVGGSAGEWSQKEPLMDNADSSREVPFSRSTANTAHWCKEASLLKNSI
jgi:hypothetical protein